MFYRTKIEIIRPAVNTAGRYGYGTGIDELSYDPANGAEVIDVHSLVELQPHTTVEELSNGQRVLTTSGYDMFTQPGVDIDLRPRDRIRACGMLLDVDGEVRRWPGYSGVDHVEVHLVVSHG
nr:MAG TPA: Minor capsid protein [Caudoviricetes sp.]